VVAPDLWAPHGLSNHTVLNTDLLEICCVALDLIRLFCTEFSLDRVQWRSLLMSLGFHNSLKYDLTTCLVSACITRDDRKSAV
jgi:hypothetical protein